MEEEEFQPQMDGIYADEEGFVWAKVKDAD
jgi:hypothetical protein